MELKEAIGNELKFEFLIFDYDHRFFVNLGSDDILGKATVQIEKKDINKNTGNFKDYQIQCKKKNCTITLEFYTKGNII